MTNTVSTCIATLCLLVPLTRFPAAAEEHRPLVVAHRGLLLHAPENTLANFRACLELRVGFEFDVERTRDGQLVSIHDGTVDRTTNGKGNVSGMTLPQLRLLDAGRWFDGRFSGERVPTVDEVLRLAGEYRERDILIAVDIKSEGVETELVRLAQKHRVLHRLLFIGRTIQEPGVRERLKSASPRAQTAAVANNRDEFASALAMPNADWVYFRYLPPVGQMDAVRRAGRRAFIAGATVADNLPGNWRQAAETGIDAILTDYALELAALLRRPPR